MRSLTQSQWQRYFDLCERLDQLQSGERLAVLQRERERPGGEHIAALIELRLQLTTELDRWRGGEQIRNLRLIEPIGCGGMGVVYRALQHFADGIEREVAVKLIQPALVLQDRQDAFARFQGELATLVKLEHRGIARIYDGGLHRDPANSEETLFLAMELIKGETLTEYIAARRAQIGVTGILRLFLSICEAMAYAHEQGVVHRDLKPDNILVDASGEPRILDFGLAQSASARTARRDAIRASGTPAYMSPEQHSGKGKITAASDVFALGVMLHELLTGRRPANASQAPPACPSQAPQHGDASLSPEPYPALGSELAIVIAKATATRAQERFESAGAMYKALAGCLESQVNREQRGARYREWLLNKVQSFWIDGVLKHSLYNAVLLELELALDPDAGVHPWDLVLQAPHRAPRMLPTGTPIGALFHEFDEAMLILGAPGAGKTTLLLELTRELLQRARQDPSKPIPVVFHLSTWARERLPLHDWLVDELGKRYDVPEAAARLCLESGLMLCMLDGLDEVAPAYRAACVTAINSFRARDAAPLAVCSRLGDYHALPVRLRLSAAVVIQPLSAAQIDAYLARCGQALAPLREVVAVDHQFQALLQTPLLLAIAALAHVHTPTAPPARGNSVEEWRSHLLGAYVEAMFKRRGKIFAYSREQTLRWLRWLAAAMLKHHQSVLYVEWIQPDWLEHPAQRWAVGPGSVLVCGISVGVLVGLYSYTSGMPTWSWATSLFFGVFGGWVFGRLGYGDQIHPITRLRWSWAALRDGIARKLGVALGVGVFLGTGVALVLDAQVAVVVGGGATVLFCYFGGLDLELIRTDASCRSTPNEGMRRSIRNALLGALVGAVTGALAGSILTDFVGGGFAASILGLIVALATGGHPCLQHFTLRLCLWASGAAPLRLLNFLEHATERIFLQRVGGGYAFVHRTLLEHFARQHAAPSHRSD